MKCLLNKIFDNAYETKCIPVKLHIKQNALKKVPTRQNAYWTKCLPDKMLTT